MIRTLYTCDICGIDQVVPFSQNAAGHVPPRWGRLQVDKGGSSASSEERMEICPACVTKMTEDK